MNMKKLLLCVTALSGLIVTNTVMALPAGSNTTITTAQAVCTGSMFGDVPLYTVVGAGQQQGMESSWLVTNTSPTDTLAITRIDSYGMDGKLLATLTPASAPDLSLKTGGFFSWTVKPYQVSRFPHDFSMVYPNAATGVKGTDPKLVRWFSVVITVANAAGATVPISTPLITAAMVERGAYTVPPTATTSGLAPVVSRSRNECSFMM